MQIRLVGALLVLLAASALARGTTAERTTPTDETPAEVMGKTFAAWRDQLADDDLLERLAAVNALPDFGPVALDLLSETIDDPEPAVRYRSIVAIGRLGESAKRMVPELQASLRDGSPIVRVAGASALCKLKHYDEAVPELIRLVQHRNSKVRLAAVTALEPLGESARPALPVLHRAMKDDDKYVVRVAARVINALEGTQLNPP